MTLLSLPLEIQQQIVDFVATLHRPSLYSFSLTSKACHKASTISLFRDLTLSLTTREALPHQIDTFVSALTRTTATRHVHRITIKGALHTKSKFRVRDSEADYPNWKRSNWLAEQGLENILADEDPNSYHNSYVVYDQGITKSGSEEDEIWAPVARLLSQTPCLKDLVYESETVFPPCVLRVLQERLPDCRLHHQTFKFRTLLWDVPDRLEMELATLQNLHSVRIACAQRDSDGDDDFNLEAVMELASMAPGLRSVSVVKKAPYDTRRFYLRRRGEWKGLPGYDAKVKGRLTSLEIRGCHESTGDLVDDLQEWSRYTDFGYLEELRVGGSYQDEEYALSGQDLESLLESSEFPRLQRLSVNLTRDDRYEERPEYSAQAVAFFTGLPPLVEISVIGPLDDSIVEAILDQHGASLKTLMLCPFEEVSNYHHGRERFEMPMQFSHRHLTDIEARCPRLRHLTLPIKRNQSRAEEVALYRCFSRMRNLQTLFLTLDCSEWRIVRDATYDPRFSGQDDEIVDRERRAGLRKGTIKEMLINCAVDEELARSIWGVITKEKTGRPMEWLKLWTKGGGDFGGHTFFSAVVKELARSWLVKRGERGGDEVHVRWLGKRHSRVFLTPNVLEGGAFREIWDCGEREDWENVWRSFPLQVDG
jgi:hypothetical protein